MTSFFGGGVGWGVGGGVIFMFLPYFLYHRVFREVRPVRGVFQAVPGGSPGEQPLRA